jgi:hypothetical protein
LELEHEHEGKPHAMCHDGNLNSTSGLDSNFTAWLMPAERIPLLWGTAGPQFDCSITGDYGQRDSASCIIAESGVTPKR